MGYESQLHHRPSITMEGISIIPCPHGEKKMKEDVRGNLPISNLY